MITSSEPHRSQHRDNDCFLLQRGNHGMSHSDTLLRYRRSFGIEINVLWMQRRNVNMVLPVVFVVLVVLVVLVVWVDWSSWSEASAVAICAGTITEEIL